MSGLPPPGTVQVATTFRLAKSITETLPGPFRAPPRLCVPRLVT